MTDTLVLDPVCGMMIEPAEAAGQFEYRGKTYYFCHPSCLERFQAAPGEFLSDDGGARPPRSGARARRAQLRLPDGSGGAADDARRRARSAAWRSSPISRIRRR